jgi:hypothetical protein
MSPEGDHSSSRSEQYNERTQDMTKFSRKLMVGIISVAVVCAFALAGVSRSQAGDPCSRKTFQTKLVEAACKAGGQDQAKKEMKAFLKKIQEKKEDFTCLNCHTSVDAGYPLKGDGLKLFKQYGGN